MCAVGARRPCFVLFAAISLFVIAGCPTEEPSNGGDTGAEADGGGDDDSGGGDTSEGSDTGGSDADGGGAVDGPTWYGAVRGIVAENCVTCHREGGIGPFSMATYEEAKQMAAPALDAIEKGRMPPWSPDPDCRRYQDERLMSEEAIATFREWVEAGTPEGEGDGAPAEAPEADELPEADIVAKPSGAYTPPKTQTDTYRCFLLDHEFDQDTYGTASWVEPDKKPIVHHVLVFLVSPSDAEQMETAAQKDGEPGFNCFGGSTGGPIGWFVPGTEPRRYDNGRGFLLPKGYRIMMQVHYNVLTAEPKPDRTTVHLSTRETEPDQFVSTKGIPNTSIEIPAGASESTHVKTITNRSDNPWIVNEIAGHMHLLGEEISLEKVAEDGTEQCLLEIPEWDFEWQQFYSMREGEEVRVEPGESLRMTCRYDNSPANQPTVDGEQISPRDVEWGEGTLDEMCLTYISVLSDTPPSGGGGDSPSSACQELADCRSGCGDPDDYACVFACSFDEPGCGTCLIDAFYGQNGCVRDACGQEANTVAPCYNQCRSETDRGDGLVGCMENRCGEDWETLRRCVSGELAGGACSGAIASCRE